MKDKDYGIILSKSDYSESSYIIKIYTSKRGTCSFIFRGAKKKKDQFKLYPLSIVELEFGLNPKSELHYLNSLSTYINISNSFFDPIKSSILFFLNEVLQKTLRDADADSELMSFLISRLKYLDLDHAPKNFHLKFLIDYSRFHGFYPEGSQSNQPYFDMLEGEFVAIRPKHENILEGAELKAFCSVLETKYESSEMLNFHGIPRSRLLRIILAYYQLQIESFGQTKTLEVLEIIFHD